MKTPVVHLTPKRTITRSQTDTRAFPLTELDMPKHDGKPETVADIIDFLNVEGSARYKYLGVSTYCNIYAYDFACLMGAYLPRVFWTEKAIKEKNFQAQYGVTVTELNANALYDWFPKYGPGYGWKNVEKMADAQALANKGKCVIMVAANKNRARSGHIVAIVPETDDHKSVGANGITIYPLQSQAGLNNKKYFASKWWNSHEPIRIYVSE